MLYFKKDSDFTMIISDKHYRNEAINALEALINGVGIKSPTSTVSLEEKYGQINYPPYLYLHPQATETRRICFELGVIIDQDGEKWKAACLEQAEAEIRVATQIAVEMASQILDEYEASGEIENAEPINTDSVLREYIKNACRTECAYTTELVSRAASKMGLLHGAIGLCTEIGELQDQIKRHVFYGKGLDIVNVEEELGDLCYYIAIICNALQLDWDNILKKNIEKLKIRYPQGFSESNAINRNITEEIKVFENGR